MPVQAAAVRGVVLAQPLGAAQGPQVVQLALHWQHWAAEAVRLWAGKVGLLLGEHITRLQLGTASISLLFFYFFSLFCCKPQQGPALPVPSGSALGCQP